MGKLSPREQLRQDFSNVFTKEKISSLQNHLSANNLNDELAYFNSIYSRTLEMFKICLNGLSEDFSPGEYSYIKVLDTLNKLSATIKQKDLDSNKLLLELSFLSYSFDSLKGTNQCIFRPFLYLLSSFG